MNEVAEPEELLSTCKHLLNGWQRARTPDEKMMLTAILSSMEKYAKIPAEHLIELLSIGFDMAVREWKTYGEPWRFVIRQGLKHYFQADHKDAIANRISAHIALQGTQLIESPDREHEYDSLTHILADIQGRELRPRNRYVIREDKTIRADLQVEGHPVITGSLVNFSIDGSGRWTPGAFIRVRDDAITVPDRVWRNASLRLSWHGEPIELGPVQVQVTDRERAGTIGFRIKFTDVPPAARASLNAIAQENNRITR